MTSLQVYFGLLLGLTPSTSKSMHFFTQSFSSFLKHAHTILTYVTVSLPLYHLFLISQFTT